MAVVTKHERPGFLRSVFVLILVFPLAALSETDSKLERFEKDATRPRTTDTPPATPPPARTYPDPAPDANDGTTDEDDDWLVTELVFASAVAVAMGGIYSWVRVSSEPVDDPTGPSSQGDSSHRLAGEALVPFARLDASYHRIGSRIHAADSRAEIGYGPFGFEYRKMRYTETEPDAVLELSQYHALYRMSVGDRVEIDVGYGRLRLAGTADNSGESWTLPILVHPSPWFGIEYRPAWARINGSAFRDQEVAISAGGRFWAVRGGYHWLESPGDSLSGPFIGLSFRL